MEKERSIDKLARYIMYAAVAAIVVALCCIFKKTLIYIIVAVVVSFVGRPIKELLEKVRIRGRSAPAWTLTLLTIVILIALLLTLIMVVIPVFASVIETVYSNIHSISFSSDTLTRPVQTLNNWIIAHFPHAGEDFRIETTLMDAIRKWFDFSSIPSFLSSMAGTIASIGVGIFCVIFISFFFIKDPQLFRKIIGALVPDRLEKEAIDAIGEIENLLTRYFAGIVLEVCGVTLINFLGLALLARIGWGPALGIAFMIGLLNTIPYVGPWIGGAIGLCLSLALKTTALLAAGVTSFNFIGFAVTVCAIFIVTQWADNFFYQPLIYSTSIKAYPLEIFLVLIMAGAVGGILGMLVAIPSYTVLRVIAMRFLPNVKAIRRLAGKDRES